MVGSLPTTQGLPSPCYLLDKTPNPDVLGLSGLIQA